MIKRFLLSIIIILTSFTIHYAQAPTSVGWSGSGTAILSYSNSCGQFTNFTCLGSGTGSEAPFIPGINYTIINDVNDPAGCPNPLTNAWIQIWDGNMSTCNSATPIGTPALNDLNVTMTGTGPYFLTVSSMNSTAADNLCGGGKGHDFTGQSATIRYRQETSVINTTSTASICMYEGKDLTYQLVGNHDNPEVEWEIISGNGNLVGSTFFATDTVEVTLRVKVGTCYDDITYKPIESSTAPTAINGPQELCGNTPFTLEAIGGFEAPGGTQYQWGKGNIVGQNPLAITPTPIYTPDLINQDESYWVRRINNTPGCNGYTLGATIDISVKSDAKETITETICEGNTYMFGNEPLTSSISGYEKVFQTVNSQCDSTVILDLIVEPHPVGLFPRDTTLCHGHSMTLDAGNPGGTYVWNTGSTERTIDINVGGEYIVNIVSQNGCSNSDTVDVELVYVYPEYSMVFVQNIGSHSFKFEVLDPIDIDEVYWNMGDGSPIKTGMTTQHTYENSGNYIVTLDLQSACGYQRDQISTHVVNISDRNNKKQIKWYPNPTKDYLIIDAVNGEYEKIKSIQVVDIQGRVRQEVLWQGQEQYRLELPDLNSGVYQILLISKDNAILHQNSIQIIK